MPTGQLATLLRVILLATFTVASSAPALAKTLQDSWTGGCASQSEPVLRVTPAKKDRYSPPLSVSFLASETDELDDAGETPHAHPALDRGGFPPGVSGHPCSHAREHASRLSNPPTGPPSHS
jgi:hypothetical protein